MSGVSIEETSPGRFVLRGPLDFSTARRAHELGAAAFAASGATACSVDCGDVGQANSAGLAVLIAWLREAQRAGRSLRYERLPPGVVAIAGISEVQELLEAGVQGTAR